MGRSVKQQKEVYWGFLQYLVPRETHKALYLPIQKCGLHVFFDDNVIKSSSSWELAWLSETEKVTQVHVLGLRKVGDGLHTFHGQKFLHRQGRARRNIVLLQKQISSAPFLRKFLPHIFPFTQAHMYVNVDSQFTPLGRFPDTQHRQCRKRIS